MEPLSNRIHVVLSICRNKYYRVLTFSGFSGHHSLVYLFYLMTFDTFTYLVSICVVVPI